MTETIKIEKKKSQKTPELHNLWGFLISIVVCSIISIIIYFTIIIEWYKLGAIFITIGYFGFGGIWDIPIGFKGVPLFLNRRISFFVLPEGFNWILPRPLMSLEKVDVKERTSDPGPITILTGKGKETVRVIADAAIQWKVVNPYKTLDVSLDVVIKGMDNLIQEVLRSSMADKTPDGAVQIHDELKDNLEKKATEKSNDWGIEIRNIFITQLGFSEDVIKEFEKITKEKKQKLAEGEELNHVRKQIEKFVKIGLSPEASKEVVQTERRKVSETIERKIYKGLEGTGAIGAIADKFLSNKGK